MKEKKSKASLGKFLIVFLCVLFIGWYFMPFFQDMAEARPRLPDRDPAVIAIPTPVIAPEPVQTAVPVIYPIIIPNPPNPDPAAFITPEAAAVAAPVEAVLPAEAVFTLTTGEWVNDANAQFLTDCAYQIAKGLAHDPACQVNSAALLGVGR